MCRQTSGAASNRMSTRSPGSCFCYGASDPLSKTISALLLTISSLISQMVSGTYQLRQSANQTGAVFLLNARASVVSARANVSVYEHSRGIRFG